MDRAPLPRPRLRRLEARWVSVDGETRLLLQDPLQLSERVALVPQRLAPLLALLDGTRELGDLARDFARRTGYPLPAGAAGAVVRQLDDALLLEGERLDHALAAARRHYRQLPYRPPALVPHSYPESPAALDALIEEFTTRWRAERGPNARPPTAPLPMAPLTHAAGVLSPHIDYQRGWATYAATWPAALEAVAGAEVVVAFGTDHRGGPGRLTPTLQHYATPWGALPTDTAAVEAMAAAAGAALAFDEELHHRREHSLELALVWLHWALRATGRERSLPALVPILCGSFYCYMPGSRSDPTPASGQDGAPPLPETRPDLAAAMEALVGALAGKRVLVVAAADLAHVGPAFGDDAPLTADDRQCLEVADQALLQSVCTGDAGRFLAHLQAERDRRRVCGLPPIYWAMRLLERLRAAPVPSRIAAYDQCPADEAFGSVVSVAGAHWE